MAGRQTGHADEKAACEDTRGVEGMLPCARINSAYKDKHL